MACFVETPKKPGLLSQLILSFGCLYGWMMSIILCARKRGVEFKVQTFLKILMQ
jgi:hypothetical protein